VLAAQLGLVLLQGGPLLVQGLRRGRRRGKGRRGAMSGVVS
jgi:hypothetical protein